MNEVIQIDAWGVLGILFIGILFGTLATYFTGPPWKFVADWHRHKRELRIEAYRDTPEALPVTKQYAVNMVLNAWNIPGPNPQYHMQMKKQLKNQWPMLYNALKSLSFVQRYEGPQRGRNRNE